MECVRGAIDVSELYSAPISSAEIAQELRDHPPHATLPWKWNFGDRPGDGYGGGVVADPLTIYVLLPFGKHEDTGPLYKTSITCLIDDLLDGFNEGGKDRCVIRDDSVRGSMAVLAKALRAQADRLDAACSAHLPAD
jgi:hypothetical protein